MLQQISHSFKVVMVGNSTVGKSSILIRFVDHYFKDTLPTIGVDFKFKTLTIADKKIKLQIWDTAGQQTFRSIISTYYNKADAIVLVFDMTELQSFRDLQNFWIEQINKHKQQSSIIVILGNKCDMEGTQVSKQDINQMLKKWNIQLFFQTSAKTANQIQKAFITLTEKLIQKSKKTDNKETPNFLDTENFKNKQKNCCLKN